MPASRLEAFSDGVIAIIITIMVLELKTPHASNFAALRSIFPTFLSYTLSFWLIAIYWVNHHYLVHMVEKVDAPILWMNLLLLFLLSLVPFATNYMNATHWTSMTVALYNGLQALCAIAFRLLFEAIWKRRKDDVAIADLRRSGLGKNLTAILCSLTSTLLAFVSVPLSFLLLIVPPLLYLVPEKRVEQLN